MPSDEKAYRRAVHGWAMYDWANSAFATTILAAVFPIYFRSLAQNGGLKNQDATALWSYVNSFAMLLIALAGPMLGAMADVTPRKKLFTGIFLGAGVLGTLGLVFLHADSYVAGSVFFVLGLIGFAGGNIFYEALLPVFVPDHDLDRVSTRGYALGYVGGGLLLVINLAWIQFPEKFFMPDKTFALKASFLSVAVWWLLFSIPFFRHVPEPGGSRSLGLSIGLVRESFARFLHTLRRLRHHPDLLLFLIAFWIYNDGVSTIIKLAAAYGDEIHLSQSALILALVITQFVGIPCAFAFGKLAGRIGAKRSVLLGISVYILVCVLGYFMKTSAHFFELAGMVGLVQGGTQALSRSLFAGMVPRERSAEFFGFFSTGEKFAGIAGPFLFGLIGQMGHSSRYGILSVIVFFVVGGVLLMRVDVERGRKAAGRESKEQRAKSKESSSSS